MTSFGIHNVNGITISEAKDCITSDNHQFSVRTLRVETQGSGVFEIDLFADDSTKLEVLGSHPRMTLPAPALPGWRGLDSKILQEQQR